VILHRKHPFLAQNLPDKDWIEKLQFHTLKSRRKTKEPDAPNFLRASETPSTKPSSFDRITTYA
tara:strand:- start:892 stop:1083 length:192 start_codon:yes stop_codon:yes gene_type:complete